ncbi:MAG: hypothetical protein EOO81_04430, partial [Oxalobacteraceae bacterium]
MSIQSWFKGIINRQETPNKVDATPSPVVATVDKDTAYVLPTSSREILPYREAYAQAIVFTKSLGYKVESLDLNAIDSIVLDKDGDFQDRAQKAAGISNMNLSAGQCLKWSRFLSPFYEKAIGKRVVPTVGQIWNGENWIFNPTFKDARRWHKTGLQQQDFGKTGNGLNLHAWLTVESGEIIDPTILSSMAKALPDKYGQFLGAIVWGNAEKVLNAHKYVPIIVGCDAIDDIGGQ